jgi:inner membrane protein
MDGLTQAVLGAACGQAVAGHKLGRKAAWFGALGGILPDFDILAGLAGPWSSMLHHRGVSHSLWFGPLVGSLLGYALWRLYRRGYQRGLAAGVGATGPPALEAPTTPSTGPPQSSPPHPGAPGMLRYWMLLFVVAILTHPLLDVFTTYGTQLLAPFDRHRFALNGVGIIDPIYTITIVIALLVGAFTKRRPGVGRVAATVALTLTTAYLFWGVALNATAERYVLAQLHASGIHDAEVRCYPTLLQLFLRRAVAKTPERFYVGYVNTLREQRKVPLKSAPRLRHPLVDDLRRSERGKLFSWFAMGQVAATVTPQKGGGHVVELSDMRYGLPSGDAKRSFWGIRARYDAQGARIGEIERFRSSMPKGEAQRTLRSMWREIFGGHDEAG